MKHINNIHISNFKSIRQASIEDCNVINVFIGKPNAGKSNLLEALGLFGCIAANNSFSFLDQVRLGVLSEIFFEHNSKDVVKLELDTNRIVLGFNLYKHFDNINVRTIKENLEYSDFNNLDIGFVKLKKYQFKENVTSKGVDIESLDSPFGSNLFQLLNVNKDLRKVVSEILSWSNLKLLIEKSTNELKIFKDYGDGTFFSLSYSLIADTIQRLIFYKIAIQSNENTSLLFEEPEAHCFEPYIQEFTNSVKYDKNNNQFFIVTHSDFIIQEFLRDEESKAKTNIYLVNNVSGETKVKLMQREKNEDVYELGMNPFFNFDQLWENN